MSALPPVVVSGLPNMMPIFMRIWLMKITMVPDLEIDAGQLAQRLAHEARLHAGLHVAHLALELGLGRQRRDRVDDQHVDGAGAHERVGDLQRLLAACRAARSAGRRP